MKANPSPRRRRLPLAVFALGLSVFRIGTTEVMVSGLLPMLSRDLNVSIPTAGLLISGYAAGVVVGGPVLTLAFLKTARKSALIMLLALFVVGQAFGSVAPSYTFLMLSRVVAALAQGALFGIGSLLAVDLAGPAAKGRALAVMFGGLTIANVLGAPFGTLIGEHWGWRASFWVVTVLALLSLGLIMVVVPRQQRPHYAGLRRELASFANPRLWWALFVTALSQAGLLPPTATSLPSSPRSGAFRLALCRRCKPCSALGVSRAHSLAAGLPIAIQSKPSVLA